MNTPFYYYSFPNPFPVRALSEKTVNEFRRALRERGNSPFTINAKTQILKAALARAVQLNWIPRNPLAGLEPLSDPRPAKWRYLDAEEIDKVIAVLREGRKVEVRRRNGRNYALQCEPNKRLHDLIVFLLNTGARLGEALALRWADVDFRQGLIRLNTSKRAARGRKAKPRYVPMNAALRELLEATPRGGGPLFEYPNNINRDFGNICKAAGIGHCRIHDLRHTAASWLAMAGVPMVAIMELLGHADLSTTLKYSHLAPAAVSEAVQALNFGGRGMAARVLPVGKIEAGTGG